jgi:hypothetical protein
MNNIDKLSNSEKLYLLNVLRKEGVQYTKNSNGYFFNMSTVDKMVRNSITDNLEYIIQNRDRINNIDKERDNYLTSFREHIVNTFKEKERKIEEDYIRDITLKPCTNLSLKISRVTKEYIDPDVLINERLEHNSKLLKSHPLYIKLKNTVIVRHESSVEEDVVEYDSCMATESDEIDANSDANYEYTEEVDRDDDDDPEEEENDKNYDRDINNTIITSSLCLKLKMDFYRSVLVSYGYEFETTSHDLLVLQEYIV